MAPKRGGGGSSGSGGGSSSACPGAFTGLYGSRVEYFVLRVLFWVVLLGVTIAWPKVRKNNPKTKRLIGPFFGFGVVFNLIAYTMWNIMSVLTECQVADNNSYYPVAIVFSIFYKTADLFLLIVAVWGVNAILRDRLGTHPVIFKMVINSTLSLMTILTIPLIAIHSYNLFQYTDAGLSRTKGYLWAQYSVAYWTLYLITLLIGGVLAIISITQMRTRKIAIAPVHFLIIGLYVSMFIWILFYLISAGVSLSLYNRFDFSDPTNLFIACYYLTLIFYSVSYVLILLIARNTVWRIQPGVHSHVVGQSHAPKFMGEYSTTAPQVVPQQQLAYNAAPQAVPQQQPVHQQPQQYVYPTGQVPQQQFYYPPQQTQASQQLQQANYNQPELVQGHQTR